MADRFGQSFMPWQDQVALVGGELIVHPETGLLVPAYRNVIVTVERQNGKTTVVLAWVGQRSLGWGAPQRSVYSAQTGQDARKKLVEDWCPIIEPRKAKLGIRRVLKANGSEAIDWRNGSRTVLMGSGEDAGHGKTVNLGIKDEFFADVDDRRDQALVPAMATVADAQILTLSTAGTDTSLPLLRAVERGRAAVERGERTGTAYFEWSIPGDEDIDDPDVWWRHIPALGYTITEQVIRDARSTLTEGEFRRAFCNQWTATENRLIPQVTWDAVCYPDVAPDGQVVFSFDVSPERDAASVAAVSRDRVVEIIDQRPGVGWLAERKAEITSKWGGSWFCDGSGPAGAVAAELGGVEMLGPGEMVKACGGFYDAVADRTVKIRRHKGLDDAVAAAKRRPVGDAWTWARRGTVDITPLVAATVGLWAAGRMTSPSFVDLNDFLDDEE